MARDHARIYLSIWESTDFTGLTISEQWTYFALISSPDLSWGRAPRPALRPARRPVRRCGVSAKPIVGTRGIEPEWGMIEAPRGAPADNRRRTSGLPHHLIQTGGLA